MIHIKREDVPELVFSCETATEARELAGLLNGQYDKAPAAAVAPVAGGKATIFQNINKDNIRLPDTFRKALTSVVGAGARGVSLGDLIRGRKIEGTKVGMMAAWVKRVEKAYGTPMIITTLADGQRYWTATPTFRKFFAKQLQ